MTDFTNLTINRRRELVAEGWQFADGIPAEGGYHAAREGGGYEKRVTPAPGAILVEKGTPGYHATVAWKTENHKTHLSHSERGWTVIHQGSPLCDYKKTMGEVMQVVAHYKITLPDVTWNGDRGEWVTTNTIEGSA